MPFSSGSIAEFGQGKGWQRYLGLVEGYSEAMNFFCKKSIFCQEKD